MKRILLALACLLPTAALAAPVELPIRHCYGGGLDDYVDKTQMLFQARIICHAETRQKGPVFNVICEFPPGVIKPNNLAAKDDYVDDAPRTITLRENLKAGTLTYTFKGLEPVTLQREVCQESE